MAFFRSHFGPASLFFTLFVVGAFAQDIATLKPGTYVRIGAPCENPSNDDALKYDGKKFFNGTFCGLPEVRSTSSKLKACDTRTDIGLQVVTVYNDQSFVFGSKSKTVDYRLCSENELRGVKAAVPTLHPPAQPVNEEVSNLDSQTKKVVLMVVGQSQIRALAFSGWENVKGPFNYLGATKQDKNVVVFVRSQSNTWLKVDCLIMDGGGDICYSANMLYTGFFSK